MRVIKSTLEPIIETWDDPGDYPSGAGGGPLPSHKYIAACDGEVVIELDADDVRQALDESFGMPDPETEPSITVKKWATPTLTLVDGKLHITLTVEECEDNANEDCRDYDDRDEDE